MNEIFESHILEGMGTGTGHGADIGIETKIGPKANTKTGHCNASPNDPSPSSDLTKRPLPLISFVRFSVTYGVTPRI